MRALVAFDGASRLRIQIFAFKLMFVAPVCLIMALAHQGYHAFGAMSFLCFWHGVFAGLAGLVQRHRLDAACLTAWDEVAAFMGLSMLARFMADAVAA